jgi:hypothetical protein
MLPLRHVTSQWGVMTLRSQSRTSAWGVMTHALTEGGETFGQRLHGDIISFVLQSIG